MDEMGIICESAAKAKNKSALHQCEADLSKVFKLLEELNEYEDRAQQQVLDMDAWNKANSEEEEYAIMQILGLVD